MKKILSIALSFLLVLSVLPAASLPVQAVALYHPGDVAIVQGIAAPLGISLSNNPDNWGDEWPGTLIGWTTTDADKRIVQLNLQGVGLTGALDVTGLTGLIELNCSNNALTSLTVSGLTSLGYLDCRNNKLTTLDVSGLTGLGTLYCHRNELTTLDVTGLTALQFLNCSANNLTTLEVTGLTALIALYCNINNLTGMTVAGLSKLTYFDCSGNNLNTLDVAGLAGLETLSCSGNNLNTLDVAGLALLKTDIPVGVWTGNAAANAVQRLFSRYFSNNIRVVAQAYRGDWGQTVRIAAKVDLTGMDVNNLYFYSYNSATNSYKRIAAPNSRIDRNGYLHFDTTVGGDIIISSGPLARLTAA